MKRICVWAVVCLVALVCALGAQAQQREPVSELPGEVRPPVGAAPQAPGAGVPVAPSDVPVVSVPRLVKVSGLMKNPLGEPRTGVVGITFALYEEQEGGAPLWLETHNVELDEQGRYTVLLGATLSEGLPLELFTSGEARWLGIEVQGDPEASGEQPRVLLVSVPYALKAAEAERLAGRSVSEFVLAEELTSPEGREKFGLGDIVAEQVTPPEPAPPAIRGSGTTGRIAKFTDTSEIGDSAIFETGGNVGIGTTTPGEKLDVAGTGSFSGSSITQIVSVTQSGSGRAVVASSATTTDGTAVMEVNATGGSGLTFGVRGTSASPNGTGVEGKGAGTDSVGVHGSSAGPNGIGVSGFSSGTNGTAVFGNNAASSGVTFGVRGVADSTGGRGVEGFAPASSGDTRGVIGISSSPQSIAVEGLNTAASGGTGVSATAEGVGGIGLTAGTTATSGPGIGVLARVPSPDGTAGVFDNTAGGKILSGLIRDGLGDVVEVFRVAGDGTVTASAFVVSSSRRWKTNIRSLEGALEKVERLRGVTYKSKANDQPNIGLIAEEVGEVVPEVVAYEENGVDARAVDYARLTALLVEAIKEQQAQIRELQAELAVVKAQLSHGSGGQTAALD